MELACPNIQLCSALKVLANFLVHWVKAKIRQIESKNNVNSICISNDVTRLDACEECWSQQLSPGKISIAAILNCLIFPGDDYQDQHYDKDTISLTKREKPWERGCAALLLALPTLPTLGQTHRTRFVNETRFSLTDNFDPSLNFPNIQKRYNVLSYLVYISFKICAHWLFY